MEGIRDGRAVDDCAYCVFVCPGATPCPRCRNRMRYVAASLGDDDEQAKAIAAWRGGDRSSEVTETLWRLGFRPEDEILE